MIIKIIKGDLIEIYKETNEITIAHGCNCFNIWDSGLALKIKEEIPQAYLADSATVKGSRLKLGTFTAVDVDKKNIINLYIYFDYRQTGNININYQDLGDALNAMNDYCVINNIHQVYIPKIGCGNGGGDWNRVVTIINQHTPDVDIIVVEYNTNGDNNG